MDNHDIPRTPVFERPEAPKAPQVLYSFPEAIRLIIEGKRITKKEWANENIYGEMKDGFLMITLADGSTHTWTVSEGDLLGEDYYFLL